jgi:chemotaxis protein CheX
MTFATASAVDVLAQAASDVFETMAFRRLVPRQPIWGHAVQPKSQIVGSVGFTGSSSGFVAFHASIDAAREVTAAMLGTPVTGGPEVVMDAIAEVTNMIAGAFRTRMARPDDAWAITVPTVTVGTDFYIKPMTDAHRALIGFAMDAHELYVELVITPTAGSAA